MIRSFGERAFCERGSNPTLSAGKNLSAISWQQHLVNECQSAEGIRWKSLSDSWALSLFNRLSIIVYTHRRLSRHCETQVWRFRFWLASPLILLLPHPASGCSPSINLKRTSLSGLTFKEAMDTNHLAVRQQIYPHDHPMLVFGTLACLER
jgi:hypothetical protein